MTEAVPYVSLRESRSEFITVRGLRYHLRHWGDESLVTSDRPPLVLMHGWMDVGASYQFMVDALLEAEGSDRWIIAPDWRGFGLTDTPANSDSYWFPDYLADLDLLLDQLLARGPKDQQIDLVGHSMGGNIVMMYGGLRPKRIRKLINLEGFGLPAEGPEAAPDRFVEWMDELKTPATLVGYDSHAAVAARLQKTNPLLPLHRAMWLAEQWSKPDADGKYRVLGDPVHKRTSANIYRSEEVLACWARVTAPVLWIEGDQTQIIRWWGDRYSKAEFHERLKVVRQVEKHTLSPAGHMLHHDQPVELALRLKAFLDA